jgi:hypothetical protein
MWVIADILMRAPYAWLAGSYRAYPPSLKSIVFLQRDFLSFYGSGEGDYSCLGGWSSLIGINVKPFLGQKPPNRIFMRLSDWWQRNY